MTLTLGKVIDVRFSGGDQFHNQPLVTNARTLSLSSSDTAYTILNQDLYDVILITNGVTDTTITLPDSSINQGREITIVKADLGSGDGSNGDVFIAASGTDTLESQLQFNDNLTAGNAGINYIRSYIRIIAGSTSNFTAPCWFMTENNLGYF